MEIEIGVVLDLCGKKKEQRSAELSDATVMESHEQTTIVLLSFKGGGDAKGKKIRSIQEQNG